MFAELRELLGNGAIRRHQLDSKKFFESTFSVKTDKEDLSGSGLLDRALFILVGEDSAAK